MGNIIISDTSCLISLDRIGCLDLLKKTFNIIYTTQIVADEFEDALTNWIQIKEVTNIKLVAQLRLILDACEASAISLAIENPESILIIDEKKGRKIARDLNVTIIGTLKVLLIAKNKGVIKSVKPIIEALQEQSFRFSSVIVNEVLKLAGEV